MSATAAARRGAPFLRQLFDNASSTYTYIFGDEATRRAVLIDPVDTQVDRDLQLLRELDLTLVYVLNTHAHADHISASGQLKTRVHGARSVIGRHSGAKADVHVGDGDRVQVADGVYLKAIETPGHTAGCVSYYAEGGNGSPGMVFTGDTLLIRGCGRTDFQGGDSAELFRSVRKKLFELPPYTAVYPAHDYHGRTVSTIGEEVKFNPRLGKDNSLDDFVHIMANLKLAYPKMMDIAVPANLNCGIPPPE